MSIRPDEISSILKEEIQNFDQTVETSEIGTVIEVGDGIARVHGLQNAMVNELLEFPGGVQLCLHLLPCLPLLALSSVIRASGRRGRGGRPFCTLRGMLL